jgi:hypothetical protein
MTEVELYSDLRELIGNPSVNEVSNRQLRKYLTPALEWLADQLKYAVVTDDNAIALTAGQLEYPLPPEVSWIVWVEWDGNKLEPATTQGWERDGLDWRDAASASPTGFAIEGRNLILNPPPASTDVTTDPTLSIRYISSTPGLKPGEQPGLSKLDQQILVLKAASRYLGFHPTPENAQRLGYAEREIAELMRGALARAHNPMEDFAPRFFVKTRRRGGAR